jgi:hypothetical protein
VVFSREVDTRTAKDLRVAALDGQIAKAAGDEKRRLLARRAELWPLVRSEKLGQVAEEFDHVHSVHRARQLGSLDLILAPEKLRPYLVESLDRGIERTLSSK